MSFEDIAAKMKARRGKDGDDEGGEQKPFDHGESFRLRGKMLGVLLRDARLGAARTVEDCARLLHVTPRDVEAWEFGDSVPSLPQLELLAYYLDVPVSHFWGMATRQDRASQQDKQPQFVALRNRMIGALLHQARRETDLDHAALAEATGIPAESIAAYESGEVAIPMHELSVLANAVNRNVTYFLESDSHIGELLASREAWRHFSELPEDARAFASDPKNIGFIHIALMLSKMPADRLREVGASILDITM